MKALLVVGPILAGYGTQLLNRGVEEGSVAAISLGLIAITGGVYGLAFGFVFGVVVPRRKR